MTYCGYITKIKELRKHSNADKLQVATLFGNDVIVDLKANVDDMGVYFPTDGKLGLEFARENNLLREKDAQGNYTGGYLDSEKRHIRTLKLRGEVSDGLYLPITSLSAFCDIQDLKEGDKISILNKVTICEKYVPKGKSRSNNPNTNIKKKTATASYPFFVQHVDTAQLAYNTNVFRKGDLCTISLKMHGTSQRTSHTIKKNKKKDSFLNKLFGRFSSKKHVWEYISGTRRVVLNNFDGGFHGSNEFRKPWHDFLVGKLQKGETLYTELVGWTEENKLIMAECDNSKTKDKEFIKQYGKKTQFTYGCENGQSDIYAYRMTMTNEDGHVVEYPTHLLQLRCEQMGVKVCPILEQFTFTTAEDLMERANKHVDGIDPIGKTHIREGIVIRIENREKFTALKHKSRDFKILEGLIKADDVLDMEEMESIKDGE